MSDFVFIRNGQSTCNLERRVQRGQQHEPPLSELGRRQSRVAADKVRNLGAALLVSSDQLRAAQTAEIIATAVRLPVHYDAQLREHDESGESARQVGARVMTLLTSAQDSSPDGPVIVVGHESPLQLAIALLLEEDLAHMQRRPLENGAVARVRDGHYELL